MTEIAFQYIGPGWSPGIPARDLTRSEAEEHGVELLRRLRSAHTGEPLYEEIEQQSEQEVDE
jgi:hypothetical protein